MNLLDLARSALSDPESNWQRRTATPEQAAELRDLIPLAFPGIGDREIAEIFSTACADPERALTSFRLLMPGRKQGDNP